jgi:hypothetical protein
MSYEQKWAMNMYLVFIGEGRRFHTPQIYLHGPTAKHAKSIKQQ